MREFDGPNYLSKLRRQKLTDFRNQLEERERRDRFRMYRAIPCGPYMVSIQASDTHYSSPRAILDDPFQYDAFEVAVFTTARVFTTRRVAKQLGIECHDAVLGYTDVETVQKIIDWCRAQNG